MSLLETAAFICKVIFYFGRKHWICQSKIHKQFIYVIVDLIISVGVYLSVNINQSRQYKGGWAQYAKQLFYSFQSLREWIDVTKKP